MAKKITQVLAFTACAMLLSSMAAPEHNPFVGSAYAGPGGGGAGGGAGGGRGDGGGAGVGGGKGNGLGQGKGQAGANGKGLASRADNRGSSTSAAAQSKETSGLAKAMSVVATTAASFAAAIGLQNAAEQQALRDPDEVDEVATVETID